MVSQLDTVVINLGAGDNLAIGDVLAISKEDSMMVDGMERDRMSFRQRMRALFSRDRLQLPGDEIGTLLVYRTFDSMSYAVVLNSLEPIEINSRVLSPYLDPKRLKTTQTIHIVPMLKDDQWNPPKLLRR